MKSKKSNIIKREAGKKKTALEIDGIEINFRGTL